MADAYQRILKRLSPAAQTAFRASRKGPTQSERELRPYVAQERQTQKEKWSWLKPVEFLFDLLQRGQYTTANVVQELINKGSFGETVQAGWEGLLGKRKGTYKTTFFGGEDVGGREVKGAYEAITGRDTPESITKPLFKIPIINADVSWADIIGFAGDVLLDPTTYLTFGATKGAKMAAGQFAEKAVKQQLSSMAPDLAKIASAGFDAAKMKGLLGESGDAALKYMTRFIKKKDMSRALNGMFRDFQKKGLKMTPEVMQDTLQKMSREAIEKQTASSAGFLAAKAPKKFAGKQGMEALMGTYRGVLEGSTEAKKGMGRFVGRETDRLKEAMASVTDFSDFAKQPHIKGAGERAWTPFGFEAFKGVRQPNLVSRSFEALREGFSKTKPGAMFDDAWWAVMNKGPVGALRKIFGVRNPYQRMLRNKEMRTKPMFRVITEEKKMDLDEIYEGVSDEVSRGARDMIAKAELGKVNPNWIADPEIITIMGVDEKIAVQVADLMKKVKGYTDEMFNAEQGLVKEGLLAEFGAREAYLPDWLQRKEGILKRKPSAIGSPDAPFTKAKSFTFDQTSQQEIAKMEWLFGLDAESAKKLVTEKNWSTHSMDLREMLMHRAIGHSQAMANAQMVRQFKEFGIPVVGPDVMEEFSKEALVKNKDLFAGLQRAGGNLEELGLFPSTSPLMEGRFFDKDVRDIIDRITTLSSSDEGIGTISKAWRWFSTHWRSIATLSPGFHLRNAQSNMYTLWVKNGPAALDMNSHLEAFVGAMYALGNKTVVKQSGIPESTINEILARQIGNRTIREIAEYSHRSGLITRATMGFDVESIVKAATKEPSALKKISPTRLSRELGSVVESTPKFQSVLTDLKRMLNEGDSVSDEMLDFSIDESKRWFFDYEDLTEAESKVMKAVIPFYTWIRKNLALQLHSIGHYKAAMSMIPKAMRAVGTDDVDLDELDDYIREEVFLPTEREGDKIRGLRLDLPFKDVNLIPLSFEIDENGIPKPHWEWPELGRDIMGMAHPIIKTFVELGWGEDLPARDIFRQRDLDATAIAPRAMRYLAANPKVLGFIDGLMRRVGMENGLDIDKDSKGRLMIESNLQRVLENNFILLQRIGQLEDLGGTIYPRLTEFIDEATGYKGGTTDTDRFFRTLSFAVGIKPREIDTSQTEYWRYKDTLSKAQAKRVADRRKGPGYTARQQKYQQGEARRMRRLGF